jgi:DNA-3-methyladenine glycosylase I
MVMSEICGWAGSEKIYIQYHDTDWGVPEYDSRALWEKLILDGFQAGLSWITILKKRENFREAFAGFDPNIRHRGKIAATISNARVWQSIEQEQGFDRYLWDYVGGSPIQNAWTTLAEVPAFTDLSTQVSKDLKKRGFKFCGPTIVYAFMQAVGMINDHLVTCPRHAACKKLAR